MNDLDLGLEPSPSSVVERQDWQWQRFLRDIPAAAAPSSPAPAAEQQQPARHRRIGLALVGLGRMGVIHLRNIVREPRAQLLYVLDADEGRLKALAGDLQLEERQVSQLHPAQYARALADPRVEAVVVASPTRFHHDQVRQALEAGKHVLCEKPLTVEPAQIGPLFELALARRRLLLCAFNRRYDPQLRYLRAQLLGAPAHDPTGQLAPPPATTTTTTTTPLASSNGSGHHNAGPNANQQQQHKADSTAGALQIIKLTSRDCERPPLAYVGVSGGLFHDSAIHELDLSLWFARSLPVSVQVDGISWAEQASRDPEAFANLGELERQQLAKIDDLYVAVALLKFANGTMASIDNSRSTSYGFDQRCELYCTRALLAYEPAHTMQAVRANEHGYTRPPLQHSFASRYAHSYENELADLLRACQLTQKLDQTKEAPSCASANGDGALAQRASDKNNKLNNEDASRSPQAFGDDAAAEAVRALSRAHLLEPYRPSLTMASARLAEACTQAFKTRRAVALSWDADFERQFELELAP